METPPATASTPSPPPVAMDWRRAAAGRPEWVFPQPAPEEVADLESRFPEIVQVPVDQLEEEMTRWERAGVVGRSFGRWISPAAIVAEFRRSGASGDIDHFGLPNGYYIFRFSDTSAREQVLRRPCVVAGQVIGLEAWRPEFLPTEEAIFSALVWIRLPNLPIEFWNESTLRIIASTAGEYRYADDFTLQRRRIGFARLCVKVDFRQALRPGTRIRGKFLPFWQQFGYEHLGQICSSCGSIHLSKAKAGCSGERASPVSRVVDPGAKFGPWMAAVRRRPPPAAASKDTKSPDGDWITPARVARRKVQTDQAVGGSVPRGSPSVPGNSGVVAGDGLVRSQVFTERPSFERAGVGRVSPGRAGSDSVAAERAGSPKGSSSSNPFAVLHPDCLKDKSKVTSDPNPGPAKRARPHDTSTSRIVTRQNNTSTLNRHKVGDKGKQLISNDLFAFSAKAPNDRMPPPPKAPILVSDAQMDLDSGVLAQGMTLSGDHDNAVSILRQVIHMPDAADHAALRGDVTGVSHSGVDDELTICDDDVAVDEIQGGDIPLQDDMMGGEPLEEAPPHYLLQ